MTDSTPQNAAHHGAIARMRAPLHIGYLVQQFLPEVGAGPARVGEMARRWREHGAELTVMTGMPNRPVGRIHPEYRGRLIADEQWEGVRVLRSWLYASPKHGFVRTVVNNASFMVTSALHALARRPPVDVLIASSPPFFPHISGDLLARAWRVPLVLELRDLWPDYLADMGTLRGAPLRALLALERHLLRRADHVVVVTDSFKRRVIDKGVPAERITVIPNGVDPSFYRRAAEPPPLPSLVREGPETFIAGYLGNIGAGQGLTTLIDAAAILARTSPGTRIVIAGDGPERVKVEARTRDLSLGNVALHPPIPKEQTRAFYNACDAVLVPLAPVPVFQETVPSKLFEALACERPVIAGLAGEGARIVESCGGVHVPPGDAGALAEAIVAMRARPAAARAAMGARGREFVVRHYGRAALADVYLQLLQTLAAARRRGPLQLSGPAS